MKPRNQKKVRIRVEWGGLTSYVDGTHFELCWDGGVGVNDGMLKALFAIDQSYRCSGHFFQGYSLRPLLQPAWRSRTRQGLDGIVMEIDAGPACSIDVQTVQKTVRFTVKELLEKRYLRWPVGAKYSGFTLCAMLDGAGPFCVDAPVDSGCLEVRFRHDNFKGAERYDLFVDNPAAWVVPGGSVEAPFDLSRPPYDAADRRSDWLLELRWSLSESMDKPMLTSCRYSPVTVRINGQTVKSEPVYFRKEWSYWVEFTSVRMPPAVVKKGRNQLAIRNDSDQDVLAVMSAQLREVIAEDLQIVSAPRWLLAGDRCAVVLRCLQAHPKVAIACRGGQAEGDTCRRLEPGEHRLLFTAGVGPDPLEIHIRAGSKQTQVQAPVYSLARENPSWKIGATLQRENHDQASGDVEYAIRYTSATQMGNYLQFRPEPTTVKVDNHEAATPEDWHRWAELLKERGIYFTVINAHGWRGYNMDNLKPDPKVYDICRILKEAAGDYFFSAHVHEYSRWIYGLMPRMETQPWAMPDAARRYIHDVAAIELIEGVPRQGGQAAPLMSYDYESGMDYIAVETMAMNNMHLLAAARGAARIFNKPVWGIHNATYWVKAPDDFTKLTLNWLNFYMTYTAGGNFAISEDGHFHIPHADRQQGFHSEEPARLREIIRTFYEYVNTHPRRGRPEIRLALAQGNHSCEIISFPLHFCWGKETIGHVWGGMGSKPDQEKWAYGDPERGLVLIDEWMPYWQDGQHIRHWFTGTPYGQFDVAPVWKADAAQLADYRVLVFLGWNTMTPELYGTLKAYVEGGGLLFMAVPHLSLHDDRTFLKTMDDLHLVREGDVRDLFGMTIQGPGKETGRGEAVWAADAGEVFGRSGKTYALSSDRKWRWAEVAVESARVLIREAKRGTPVLVEKQVGKGRAWLLTAWAYPGHPAFESLARDVMALLGEQSLDEVRLEDFSREVAWYVWKDRNGFRNIYLLNTDWTERGIIKSCRLKLGRREIPIQVREGTITTVSWLGDLAVYPASQQPFIEDIIREDGRRYRVVAHGQGKMELWVHALAGRIGQVSAQNGRPVRCAWDGDRTCARVRLGFKTGSRLELVVELI